MRNIDYIVIHCTATQPDAKVSSIQKYWRDKMGWKSPGYHRIIRSDGLVVAVQDDSRPTNGVKGHNHNSIHISYIGGIDKDGKPKDTRTPAQLSAMADLVRDYKQKFPKAKVLGHRDFPGVNKACPSFDVSKWLTENNI